MSPGGHDEDDVRVHAKIEGSFLFFKFFCGFLFCISSCISEIHGEWLAVVVLTFEIFLVFSSWTWRQDKGKLQSGVEEEEEEEREAEELRKNMCGRGASEANEEGRSTWHGIVQKRSSKAASGKERRRGRHRLYGPPACSRRGIVKRCLKAATAPKNKQPTAILFFVDANNQSSSRY